MKGLIPDDDDDDEFSPFGTGLPKLHHLNHTLSTNAKPFEPFTSGDHHAFVAGTPHSESGFSYNSGGSGESSSNPLDPADVDDMTSNMTPLDVLSSVFTTIPRSELEDALHRSGYDFEASMAYLVSQHTLPRSGASTPGRASPRPMYGIAVGNRAMMAGGGMQHGPREGYFQQGGRSFNGSMSPGLVRSPGGMGTRMCRYYLSGECRRSDCRFR
jgi:hypothetical protein